MTTKEDSELSGQKTTKKEQDLWDKSQEDSEEDQTKETKDSLQAYLAANQDANEPRESVLHGLQERIRWDQPLACTVENLPSFCTLVNIKKLLAINNVFWRYCKKSSQPEKIEARYAKTLMTLNDLIDGKQDSSHSCVLRYEQ
ncbi:hypothetical protein G6F16_007089 [Rhizopus arrhizus]|nr:hypothetical protein G6F24_005952 [Rhizopus arrhizus]KAG0796504.1 hypothetical protein G6F21_001249 [Rhizopus arrhizus]KAG0812107.1 hypothetical protein G6F20_006623 [Rhizopus arrhizus]KAG0833973.1 hypothetical protein G6F18_006516 [Rhizopus arrhizus]KAG0838047.1 hypothetical protein G6F19_003366 [Rhizopus arrhizus]